MGNKIIVNTYNTLNDFWTSKRKMNVILLTQLVDTLTTILLSLLEALNNGHNIWAAL